MPRFDVQQQYTPPTARRETQPASAGLDEDTGGGAAPPRPLMVPKPVTGGGQPLTIDPVSTDSTPVMDDEWLGINQAVSPDRLGWNETPYCVNFEGASKRGALRSRRGFAKLSAHANNADGVFIAPLKLEDADGKALLLAGSWTGSQLEVEALSEQLTVPPLAPPAVAPTVAFSFSGSNVRSVFSAMTAGKAEWVWVRISTVGFPTSPWGHKGTNQGDGLASDDDWNGAASKTIDIAHGQTSGTVLYISAWYANRMGFSPVTRGTLEVA